MADFLEQESEEPAPSGVLKRRAPDPSPGMHVSDGVARPRPRKARGEQGAASAQQRAAVTGNPDPNYAGEQPCKAVGEQPRKAAGKQPRRSEGEKIDSSLCGGHCTMQYRWTEGRHIPSTAKLSLLTDTQLAHELAHHCLLLPLASSYWIVEPVPGPAADVQR
eukprot:1430186-Rhodomonas_salina.1